MAPKLDWPLGPAAHRGLHDLNAGRVENSAGAAEAALEAGYSIEVDLQVSSDGVPVVFHDPTLERLTEERGPVSERSAAELRRIKYRTGGETIIDLAMLLEIVDGKQPIYVETKSLFNGDRSIEEGLPRVLNDYRGPLALMSFDPAAMHWCREHLPNVPRGLISGSYDGPAWEADAGNALNRFRLRNLLDLWRADAAFVNYSIHSLEALAPQFVRRRLGLPLLTWTVRTEAERVKAALLADAMVFEGFLP